MKIQNISIITVVVVIKQHKLIWETKKTFIYIDSYLNIWKQIIVSFIYSIEILLRIYYVS